MSCICVRGRLVALTLLAVAAHAADDAPPIIVSADPEPGLQAWLPGPPSADLGAWLSGHPGVRVVRMGGHGLDPVVDGQGAGRLNVTLDCCPVQGGCPNRMDPPTSYASAGAAGDVVLQRGRGDVRQAGGSAGSVQIERTVPVFAADGASGRVGGTVAGQGAMHEGWADVSAGGPQGGMRVIASSGAADDYENGSGTMIPSSWRQQQATLVGAWRPAAGQDLTAGGSVVRGSDMRYAGASMDSPQSDLVMGWTGSDSEVGDWRLGSRAFLAQVDHVMDNYSLRTLTTPMAMRAVTSADVLGGRIDAERRLGEWRPAAGLDLEVQRMEARRTRAANPTAARVLESVLWPEVELARFGGYAELTHETGAWRMQAGVRLDVIDSSAGALDEDPVGTQRSPRQLYQLYYGDDGGERREWLPGAVLALGRTLGPDGSLSLTVGRTMRAADTTERFIASNSTLASGRWIGNPDLAAEAHHQVRFNADWKRSGEFEAGITAFADRVQDHILRDRARGQEGIQQSDGATIYHGTEALYLGSGAQADWRIHRHVSVAGNVDQVWAKDLDSGLPLAQIPPISGSATLRGHGFDDQLTAAATVRWATRQSRVDDDINTGSGLDPGEGPGWAVLDMRLSWTRLGLGELAVGCDNIFDRTYAEHLAKPGTFDPTVSRVDEPGRSLWASAVWTF